ncbi:MAG: DUF2520 domain-containing protein [Flavobacteriaceae bacterium]|nr:DUF2520 domain-containing protein [Flavobacteriaceae bacterium]
MNQIRTVSIIGAGNVAFHLARAFVENTIQVNQIYNRTLQQAQKIGEAHQIKYTDKISELVKSDLFVIAASDSAITELSLHIPFDDVMVVHTSGSIPMNALRGDYKKGVFYPLQTFSKGRNLEYDEIPIFIETEKSEDEKILFQFADRISNHVEIINSEQRAQLHLAAVWVCNFVNHMYYIGEKLTTDANLPFDYLKPLIEETAAKIKSLSPYDAQTGPAKRADHIVMQKHLELLQNQNFKDMYEKISKSIAEIYKNEL